MAHGPLMVAEYFLWGRFRDLENVIQFGPKGCFNIDGALLNRPPQSLIKAGGLLPKKKGEERLWKREGGTLNQIIPLGDGW